MLIFAYNGQTAVVLFAHGETAKPLFIVINSSPRSYFTQDGAASFRFSSKEEQTHFAPGQAGARSKFWGLSGSEDRGEGDNSIQFINFGTAGDKSFEK